MKVLGSRKQMWLQHLRMDAVRFSESQLLEILERWVEEYEDLTWDDIAESGLELPKSPQFLEERQEYNCLYGCPPSNFKH